MKHLLIICLAAWLGANSLMAQEVETDTVATKTENNEVTTHDIKGIVKDRQGRPIVGALVRVVRTDISVVTDIDGRFLLEDVPVTARGIVVESVGMEAEEWDIWEPMRMPARRKKVTFVAQAGLSMSRYTYYGGSFKLGYEVGLGIEVRTSRKWAFRPMLQLSQRGTEYKQEQNGMSYQETWSPLFLDLPLYFVNRHRVAPKWNIVFSFGPVFSYGFGGNVKTDFNGQQEEIGAFDKVNYDGYSHYRLLYPFNFGVAYSLGVEWKQLTVGVWGKNMALPSGQYDEMTMDPCEHNWALTFGAAYRF